MKKLLMLILTVLLLLSLAACGGGGSETAADQAGDNGQVQSQDPSEEQDSDSLGSDDIKGILCASYDAYDSSLSLFYDYIGEYDSNQEIVETNQSMVMPLELKNLNYLLPLSFMGQSLMNSGESDTALESEMLKMGWADDAALTYNRNDGYQEYLVNGSDSNGSMLEIKAKYDDDSDSLRMEGYKDGNLDMVFEYVRTQDGYAAQYHYKTIVEYDKLQPIEGLCTYKILFANPNGSCARYDNVSSEPASIFGQIPDEETFIKDAAHWFTLNNGGFTGKLNGEAF